MQPYFLDTSALIKRYVRWEVGHHWMAAICARELDNVFYIAEVTLVEAIAALANAKSIRAKSLKTCTSLSTNSFWVHLMMLRAVLVMVPHPHSTRDAERSATNSCSQLNVVRDSMSRRALVAIAWRCRDGMVKAANRASAVS